jgi:hypothetical protein
MVGPIVRAASGRRIERTAAGIVVVRPRLLVPARGAPTRGQAG